MGARFSLRVVIFVAFLVQVGGVLLVGIMARRNICLVALSTAGRIPLFEYHRAILSASPIKVIERRSSTYDLAATQFARSYFTRRSYLDACFPEYPADPPWP